MKALAEAAETGAATDSSVREVTSSQLLIYYVLLWELQIHVNVYINTIFFV